MSDVDKDSAPPPVNPGPIVGVDDPDDPRLDLYRHLNDPAGRNPMSGTVLATSSQR